MAAAALQAGRPLLLGLGTAQAGRRCWKRCKEALLELVAIEPAVGARVSVGWLQSGLASAACAAVCVRALGRVGPAFAVVVHCSGWAQ